MHAGFPEGHGAQRHRRTWSVFYTLRHGSPSTRPPCYERRGTVRMGAGSHRASRAGVLHPSRRELSGPGSPPARPIRASERDQKSHQEFHRTPASEVSRRASINPTTFQRKLGARRMLNAKVGSVSGVCPAACSRAHIFLSQRANVLGGCGNFSLDDFCVRDSGRPTASRCVGIFRRAPVSS